ncbi:pimeloyl-ACP methyl ester carboxylesterase [Actinocorallia herbida]|uniref:Pimeloyl-ACP methyl ester carboxylesterase n=1 Tax=Actinocorallia herbida TaxID=58109 RepID=A0A3N1CXT4_9ACTN|nr:alpha/beta hydrolase [Actinocorallia herbida]ROO86102.1 pimeloyl-ACP methyl ester carboxylesterase [Actinocorallia herbida]
MLVRVEWDGVVLTLSHRGGVGTPLVIVPGVMADAASWRPVVDALATDRPVYVLNRRGRRPSGPLGDGYSIGTEVDDLCRVLDDLGTADGVDLFGWSYGGLIALEAATRHPGIRSLTLYEPVVRPFGAPALDALRQADEAGDLDLAVEIVNRDVSGFSAEYVAELRRTPVWQVLRPLAAPLARELGALNDHEADLPGYGLLAQPVTLLLGGDNEGALPYGEPFARIAEAMPRARVRVMPGQGHLAHAQDPGALAAFIDEALDWADRARVGS